MTFATESRIASCPAAEAAVRFLYVDLFCGAGGTTTGLMQATDAAGHKICLVIACVNHYPVAIQSHRANNPGVVHFTEDMRTLNLTHLRSLCRQARRRYPAAKLVLWASLECTNFSNAKGGLPRDADSRTLADHLPRYVEALNPDYVQIENVREFMAWGPLDANGKPLSRKNGRDWLRWRRDMCQAGGGYTDRWQMMNSANYGARTSRERLFGIFAKAGLPVAWPAPTHARKASAGGKLSDTAFTHLQQWLPVRDCLDLSNEGTSIFERKIPLVENTLLRIYAGLQKFVTKDRQAFITKGYSGDPASMNIPVEGPAGTITTKDSQSLVLVKYYGTGGASSGNEPAGTITTKDRFGLCFISHQYGNGHNDGLDRPLGAITTNPKAHLVSLSPFILSTHFTNIGSKVDAPLGVITANRKWPYLVTAGSFLYSYNSSTAAPTSIEAPAGTITATRWHYLVNPQYSSAGSSIDRPCFTLIARMGKRPPLLVSATALHGTVAAFSFSTHWIMRPTDSPATKQIRAFMAANGISDIKMRMLQIPELKRIQGFPEDYVLCGTLEDQKKFIGNSVVPHVVRAWAEALATELDFVTKDNTKQHVRTATTTSARPAC